MVGRREPDEATHQPKDATPNILFHRHADRPATRRRVLEENARQMKYMARKLEIGLEI
jgi:hypothetical protein